MDMTVAETRYGRVRGEREGSVTVWRGIPYAKVVRRFQRAEQPPASAGICEARAFGPMVPQGPLPTMFAAILQSIPETEGGLNLNVWSPAPDNRQRPVMVWIHGGAFA